MSVAVAVPHHANPSNEGPRAHDTVVPPPATQVRRATGESAMSALASGPMSRPVMVPDRPKPGRKPIANEENTADRRRAQNRNAQRNFRDKRQQRVVSAFHCSASVFRPLTPLAGRAGE